MINFFNRKFGHKQKVYIKLAIELTALNLFEGKDVVNK